ncbi:MAG: ATP-binding protein [Bacteroides sp.]|nr:ATP-binding protein [Bacteroides sp.]MCM1380062.1 ATP-binding protein [Bacteroides sp.]MCM1446343.1 ATP-binding protein [Prevotella sp.]
MVKDEKQQIAQRLKEYCEKMGSQNKAARSLNGTSTATVSKMLSGDWDTISDDMWRAVGAQLGHDSSAWQIVKTNAYKRMAFLMQQAKEESLVIAITGFAGCGKTEAIKSYTKTTRSVYHLMCSEYWNRPTFINKLLRALGKDVGGSVADQMEAIVETLNSADAPLIILDEADKLRDQVLYFFISLYNQLEGHCGIILVATEYLKNRIERGVRLKKKGYEEIYSRIGRKFVQLQVINGEDIAAVCKANGVTDPKTIQDIIASAECDLRRVKRAVWAAKKKGGAQ